MIVHRDLPDHLDDARPVVCSVGTFDGVHLGHQRIINRMVDWAGKIGGQTAVLTFARNPQADLRAGSGVPGLTDLEEKIGVFQALGIDRTVVLEFTPELAGIEPADFIRRHLVPALEPAGIVLGPGHRFGRGGRGGWALLSRLSPELGFDVKRVRGVRMDGGLISSTRVRRLIKEGNLVPVHRYLGRPFTLAGWVVKGDNQAAGLGYPTANLQLRNEGKILPPDGVYAARVGLDKEIKGGVMYIGKRPTFAGDRRNFEVHLFDFSGRLYGRELVVFLLERIRGDRLFPDVESLKAMIGRDENEARRRLEEDRSDDPVPAECLLG